MDCLHPFCPGGRGAGSWEEVIARPELMVRSPSQRASLATILGQFGAPGAPLRDDSLRDSIPSATRMRLLKLCPCLYTQLAEKVTAEAVVHLCELTIGAPITSDNVETAFEIQHPSRLTPTYLHPPLRAGAGGGEIMEALCSEVLQNSGVPHMEMDADGWPRWSSPAHVSLNRGKMRKVKLYGDLLIPSAPHNVLISVKSEAARERFIVSGNRLESVGFGFFNDPSEFWTPSRMDLLKRWGFAAVYMPSATVLAIEEHLRQENTSSHNVNINGRPLFRPLTEFGPDMCRVAGKLSFII